jgi:hypothetical protein|tara:strand:- start:276 stop:536 length:261 start_codon:yes stop_codon:yes gene_type:complete
MTVKKALGFYGPETERIKEKFNQLKILFGTQYTTKFINSNLPLPSQIELLKDLSVIIAMPSTFPNELANKCKNLKLIQFIVLEQII